MSKLKLSNNNLDWSHFAESHNHKRFLKERYGVFANQYRREVYLSLLKFVKVRGETADIGCGSGFLGEEAMSIGLKIKYGVDMNPKLVKASKGKYKITMKGDITKKLPFKDNSLDIIFLSHLIAHVTDKDKAIQEVRRVLKPEGYLILSMPDRRYLDMINMAKMIIKRKKIRKTPNLFNPLYFDELESLIERNGFDIIKHYKTYHKSVQVMLAKKENIGM